MNENEKVTRTRKIARAKLSSTLAIAALVVYVVSNILFLRSSALDTYPNFIPYNPLALCNATSMALAVVSIVTKPRSLSNAQVALAAVAMLAFLIAGERLAGFEIAQACLLFLAIAGIDFSQIGKAYYRAVLAIVVLVVVLTISGILYNKDFIPNNRLVFSFGFVHPNTLGGLLFAALSAMIFACWKEKSWVLSIALAIITAVFCYCVLSSHASAAILGLLALCGIVGHTPFLQRRFAISRCAFIAILIIVPAVLLVTMLACMVFYDASNPVVSALNKLTHGRLLYGHQYYANHNGFAIFGKPFVNPSQYHNGLPFESVDSGYYFIPIVYGLFSQLSLIAIYVVAVIKLSRHENRFAIMSLLLIASLYMLIESYAAFPFTSFVVLFLAEAFAPNDYLLQS